MGDDLLTPEELTDLLVTAKGRDGVLSILGDDLRRRRSRHPRLDRGLKKMSVTYVVHAPAAKLVKIGRTSLIRARLRAIRLASPVPVDLVALFRGDVEMVMHDCFRMHRSHGEWFEAAPVIDFLYPLGVMFDG